MRRIVHSNTVHTDLSFNALVYCSSPCDVTGTRVPTGWDHTTSGWAKQTGLTALAPPNPYNNLKNTPLGHSSLHHADGRRTLYKLQNELILGT